MKCRTLPAFHEMGVDFDDGSPVSFRWNSFVMQLFSKYGFSSKYCKQQSIKRHVVTSTPC